MPRDSEQGQSPGQLQRLSPMQMQYVRLFQNKRTLGFRAQICSEKKKKGARLDKCMHPQTTTYSPFSRTRIQWSQGWLLPVGLWSLNCLSDSSLSKFTLRDAALCLPQPLQLKGKKKHTDKHAAHAQTRMENTRKIAAP